MTLSKKIILTLTLFTSAEFLLTSYQNSTLANTLENEREIVEVNSISDYDMIFRSVADSTEWDWRLLAAIAHTESNFTPDARSHRGATGLMQIMPRTAKAEGYDQESLTDPQTCVELAVKLLTKIEGTFRFPNHMSEEDRLSVILASYNAGTGYMIETRKVAYSQGAAYNNWKVLEGYVTRNNTHYETTSYVKKVLRTYAKYKVS